MKICRVCQCFSPPPELRDLSPHMYNLSTQQIKLGLEIKIISDYKEEYGESQNVEGIEVYRFDTFPKFKLLKKFPFSMFYFGNSAYKIMKNLDFDILHGHNPVMFGATSLHKIKKPFLYTIHGTLEHPKEKKTLLKTKSVFEELKYIREIYGFYYLNKFNAKRADLVSVGSNEIKEDIVKSYKIPKENIYVIPSGVDTKLFSPKIKDIRNKLGLKNKKVVIYTGRMIIRKGIAEIIDSIKEVSKKIKNVVFLFVGAKEGQDMYDYLMKKSRGKELKNHIKVVKQVNHLEIPKYYASSDVLVMPSVYETIAKGVMEAMACGVPPIASDISGHKDIIKNGVEGYLIPPLDSKAITEKLIKILSDNKKRELMGKKSREKVVKCLDWSVLAKKYIPIYERLLKK